MNYLVEVAAIREADKGTEMIVLVPGEEVADKILKYRHCGKIEADLLIDDKRRLSNDQRKKIFAIIGDISKHTGHAAGFIEDYLRYMFVAKTDTDIFSLSRRKNHAASIEIARQFITYLIDFCFKWEIGTEDTLLNKTDDIDTYLYLAIKYRKCAICNEAGADLHHALDDIIGMGRNRKKANHVGRKAVALCRLHHTEIHSMSEQEFYQKYHIYPVKLSKQLASDLKL